MQKKKTNMMMYTGVMTRDGKEPNKIDKWIKQRKKTNLKQERKELEKS